MGSEQALAISEWPGAALAALAERIGELRGGAAGLLPDADWEDAASQRYAERAAEVLAELAAAEQEATALARRGAP